MSDAREVLLFFFLFFGWRFALALVCCRAACARLLAAGSTWRRRRRSAVLVCWAVGWSSIGLGLVTALIAEQTYPNVVFELALSGAILCGLLAFLGMGVTAAVATTCPTYAGERRDAWLCLFVAGILGTPFVLVVVI